MPEFNKQRTGRIASRPFCMQEKMQKMKWEYQVLLRGGIDWKSKAYTECGSEIPWDSYKNFIKCTLFRTYFIHKAFTKVNIHPSEVNLATFFLESRVL